MIYPEFFDTDRALVDEALGTFLPPETEIPTSIHEAMRYSVFAGGKRLRPILCIESARLFSHSHDEAVKAAMPAACAVEFIHTYSLIHDDLPALDNDDLRRGKPTCHKKFGEAMAILAGDALLTLAFETLAKSTIEPKRRVKMIAEVATAAGTMRGMVGGQVADIEAERKKVDLGELEYIHQSKTAALIRASVLAGAISGGAGPSDVERLRRFGDAIGWAFQIVDDILDVEESSAALGKTAGKDQAQQKATYPSLLGLEESRDTASDLHAKANAELDGYGDAAENLRELAKFLITRRA
jgi:geranylgeranyl diphosphate synthase type II